MNYSKFLFESNGITGTAKRIKLIDPSTAKEFFETLAQDTEIDNDLAAVTFLCFFGGLRITECLQIKRLDIRFDGKFYSIEIGVLKKRTDNVKRTIVLHPMGNQFLEKIIKHKRYNEFLFKTRLGAGEKSRFNIHYQLKKHFGMTPHLLRHSAVSLHLFLGRTDIQIATTFKMSVNNVRNYIHSNTEQDLKKMMINF